MTGAILGASALAPAARADVVEGYTVTDANERGASKKFPTPPGNDPYRPFPSQVTLDACKEGVDPASSGRPDYMVAVRMRMGLTRQNGHQTTFTVSWPDYDSNDIDLYVYNPDGTQVGNSVGDAPEKITVTDMQNGEYYFCVLNRFGGAQNFTISSSVSYDFQGVDRPPSPTPKPTSAPPGPTAAPARTPEPTADTSDDGEPTPTPEAIATIGPDGPVSPDGLPIIAAGRQGSRLNQGNTARTVFVILTFLAAAGGAVFVVLRIRRDRAKGK
jgi:hypothetical protein